MRLQANRAFKCLEAEFQPGDAVADELWARLSERTRRVLVSTKFVIRSDEERPVVRAPVKRRARRKVAHG